MIQASSTIGQQIADIFAEYESQLIINRKQVLKQAITDANTFRATINTNLGNYASVADELQAKMLKEIQTLITADIKGAVEKGTSKVDTTIKQYEQSGYTPKQTPNETGKAQTTVLIVSAIISTMLSFAQIANAAKSNALSELMAISNQTDTRAEDLGKEVDSVQDLYLQTGLKSDNGTNITSSAEYITRDSLNKTELKAIGQRNAEYGNYLVQVSAHPSSCPLCSPWQGKVLIDDVYNSGKPDGKHELLSTAIDAGLGHYNCSHNWYAYVEGYDNPNLQDKDIASKRETANRYAVQEEQRYNERNIRKYKRVADGALSENERVLAEQKVSEWQARQKALQTVAENKGVPFYRQYAREQIGGETRPTIKIIK